MKNIIVISLLLSFILCACSDDISQKVSSSEELQLGQMENSNIKDKITIKSGYQDIRISEELRPWQETDLLYKNTIEGKEPSVSLTNFKQSVIKDLVFKHDLINIESQDKIQVFEFYADEIYNTENLSLANCSYLFLSNLSNHWTSQKIKIYAKDAIEKGKEQKLRLEKAIQNLSTTSDNLNTTVVKNLEKSLVEHDNAILKLKTLTE